MYEDPTKIRLSDSILLSDLLKCDSVMRYGYPNRYKETDTDKLAEGVHLAKYLDEFNIIYGPFSISYGYVSPELSQKIVKYQDPNKPSYHRWELGAAADLCFHDQLDKAPIYTAHAIDSEYHHYSRMITYSESKWLCFAVFRLNSISFR